MRSNIMFVLFIVTLCGCYEEPIWCNSTLYLTVVNQRDTVVYMDYQLNTKNYIWKDSIVMVKRSGEKKEEITLKMRNLKVDPLSKMTDTITYKYYQQDGPCARSGLSAKYQKILLHENTETSVVYDIYPWDTDIYFEHICDGCKNVYYDTIVLK